jgi:predicted homoserine dehydrogenase-like protein
MIIVDNALRARQESGNPVNVAMVGAGYSGRNIADQIASSFPAIRLVAISNRSIGNAEEAFRGSGIEELRTVSSAHTLENAISDGIRAVTDDPNVICEADRIDVIIEATGTVEFGCNVVQRAIECRKHVVLMNVDLDATIGPLLKRFADRAAVVYSNTEGGEPGVAINMLRFVRSIGLTPMVAGNLKGLYDPYRTPETQRGFARQRNQKAETMTSFADGTKLSMELTVLANATGFGVGKRGMYGAGLNDVKQAPGYYKDKLLDGGIVDFLEGASSANGAFVLATADDDVKQEYLEYLKMGKGPLYAFYTPFHLPQLEIPNTIARVALFADAAVAPIGASSCDAVCFAKRELKQGEILDGIGGCTCYTLMENYATSREEGLLPMGVSEDCKLMRPIEKDVPIKYEDVELPRNRVIDRLRERQDMEFPVQ